MDLKAIVTNRAALKSKYKAAGLKRIDLAVKRLIKADKASGIESRVFDISSKTFMESLGESVVTNPAAMKPNKDAVDAVCDAEAPAYVMLLGGPDIIPHQRLKNPVEDQDDDLPSDLPYACTASYNRDVVRFLGPTRVVGRLPDVTGASDPKELVKLLDIAKAYKQRSASLYENYMGISAEAWKESSRLSARKVFGTSTKMALSPPKGPTWPAATLKRRSHFINCHGAPEYSSFLGEAEDDQYDQPVAIDSSSYKNKITAGTLAAAECCYGAELFDPWLYDPELELPISNRLLIEGAYAFLGSTNIAYGPAEGNSAADYICQFFFRFLLDGASLGRAMLQTRHEYVQISSQLDTIDHKTLGQFILLGDPSMHPVRAKPTPKGKSTTALKAAKPKQRAHRRKLLANAGKNLAKTTAVPDSAKPKAIPNAIKKKILASLDTKNLSIGKGIILDLSVTGKAGAKATSLKRSRPSKVYVIAVRHKPADTDHTPPEHTPPGERSPAKGKSAIAKKRIRKRKAIQEFLRTGAFIVAKEVDGKLESIEELRPR